MGHFLRSLAIFFYSLGCPGLLLLGALDSSFLILPLGNDLLIAALTAAHRQRIFWYVVMATVGSVAGRFHTLGLGEGRRERHRGQPQNEADRLR